jgi:transcriptional regulator with XRE-family HTH domain
MNVSNTKRSCPVNIKSERRRRGWTLLYVASQIGISVSALSDMENGRCSPSLATYQKLMSLFGHSVPRLVFGEAGGEPSEESITDGGMAP